MYNLLLHQDQLLNFLEYYSIQHQQMMKHNLQFDNHDQ